MYPTLLHHLKALSCVKTPDKVEKIRKNVSGLMNLVEDLKSINTKEFDPFRAELCVMKYYIHLGPRYIATYIADRELTESELQAEVIHRSDSLNAQCDLVSPSGSDSAITIGAAHVRYPTFVARIVATQNVVHHQDRGLNHSRATMTEHACLNTEY